MKKIYLRLIYDIWRRLLPKYLSLGKGSLLLECGTGPEHLLGYFTQCFPQSVSYGLDIDAQAVF